MCGVPYGIVPDPSRSFNVLIHPQRFGGGGKEVGVLVDLS